MEKKSMLIRYLEEALDRAHYEIIQDGEPYYAITVKCRGWKGSGPRVRLWRNACRNLAEPIEDWLLFSVVKGLPAPTLGEPAAKS